MAHKKKNKGLRQTTELSSRETAGRRIKAESAMEQDLRRDSSGQCLSLSILRTTEVR